MIFFRSRFLSTIEIAIILVLVGAALNDLLAAKFANVALIMLALFVIAVPTFLKRLYDVDLPRTMYFGYVVFIFTTIFLGEIQHFYDAYWWWDTLLHALAGFGLTLMGYILLACMHPRRTPRPLPLLAALFAFSFAVSLSALWEAYEFGIDSVRHEANMQPSASDTMWDLIGAAVAAVIAAAVGMRWWQTADRSLHPVARVLDDGTEQAAPAVNGDGR